MLINDTAMNLYNKENELQTTWSPALLNSMVEKSHQWFADEQTARRAREAAKQYCRVGKTSDTYGGLPAVQVRAIFRKPDENFRGTSVVWAALRFLKWGMGDVYGVRSELFDKGGLVPEKNRVGSLVGNECPGAGCSAPAGRRSRTEWCEHGNVIND